MLICANYHVPDNELRDQYQPNMAPFVQHRNPSFLFHSKKTYIYMNKLCMLMIASSMKINFQCDDAEVRFVLDQHS
jgi:hypothetical protein